MKKTIRMTLALVALLSGAAGAANISVGPLLTTKWDQISPYINFGPIKPDQEEGYSYENHMVNGCVAVAYSQVLKYWNWPEVLDEDISYSHMANSTHGYVQTLPAGTAFNWDEQLDDYVTSKATQAEQLSLGLGQIYTAMLTEMKFNLTMSGVNLERAIDNSYYNPGELLNTVGATTLDMCKDQARDSIVGGMPLIMGVTVNYSGSSISHAIVGDGWKESDGSDPQISCNYGWGGTRDGFTAFNLETSRFIANLKPRPMVIIDAVPYHAALPVTVTWHFPKKGYEKALTGFNVNAYKVTDELFDWEETFDSPKGSSWGEGVSTGPLAGCGNDGKMLKFSTESGRDYYAWPTMFLGEGSVLSFRVRSDHIRSHQTAWVEAYEAHRGWKKVHDLTLYEFPPEADNGWENVSISLDACYNNKAVGFRIRTARAASGDNWGQALAYGIQIDDVKVTNVRKVETKPTVTKAIADNLRSASFDSGLDVGTKYMFVVEPIVEGGVKSNATGAEIVAEEPEKVRFYGVQSIHSGDPQFDAENIFREAYLGINQFAVFGSKAMTKLRAKLSQTQLIDFCWAPDAAGAPGAVIASCGPVSVADAVKVECAEPGKFLVTVDFSCCSKALRFTREIITLEGEDGLGNIVRKNIVMRFSKIGNETAITKDEIPAYGGSIPSDEPSEEPDEPSEEPDEPSEEPDEPSEEPDEPSEGDDPLIDPTDGNPNDFTEGGVNYRFCNGVDKSSGFSDVHRSGSYNTLPPISYNLIYWWVSRYQAAFGNVPNDYSAPSESTMATSDSGLTIAGYTATLLNSALPTTLPVGTEREKYFPSDNTTAAKWYGEASDRAIQVGRHIYAALAKGPIGFKAHTSSSKFYCGVIWGCEYAADDTGKYATKLWVSDTRTKGDGVRALSFGNYSNSYGELPGLKDFNGSGTYGVIEYYYPIVGPAMSQPETEPDPEQDPDDPEVPSDPSDPSDEPVISGQQAGGNAVDTGTIDTSYGFRLISNYWLARKTAIEEKKQLFILSGASWCSYCTKTKEFLATLGDTFTEKFVVYYVDRNNLTASPYFKGGLPQYGSADPRKVNPFAGIYGDGTSGTADWTKAWYASNNGLYYGNRGGFSQDEINRTLSAAADKSFGDFERLEIRGPSSVMSGKANAYTLYAVFADGTEMPVDHGVTWSLMSGAGTMVVSTADGDASATFTVTSDQAVLRAESTYYFDGAVDLTVKATEESKIKDLAIVTDALNLEDNRSPMLEATATLDDDTVVEISGVGTWTINSHVKMPRNDEELESSQEPNVTVDAFGQLTYNQGYQFDVYDHVLNVTLTANGHSVTKDIKVWGPTKVVPDSWELASKTKRLTRYGVVRLKCAKLRYNYGGEIKTTSDTYYGNFRTAMQLSGGTSEYSYLRGLAFMSSSANAGTWTMGLQAQRVNGQCQYWTPENFANFHSEQIENVAEGNVVSDAAHGLVTEGFFNAYWPGNSDYATLLEQDSDNDGFTNWQEYILGTDPTDASDALTLTQGYQHLTAPANDLEAFQYKIMFAQRPGRYYYIYAKENWADEWTRVAKINYSGMAADQGRQITILDQTKADNGKFFRVGAVLADHEFYDRSNAEVIPNMLVAAPDSLIDLSSTTLPLNLTSFDTDATHAGTVNVKVPESAQTPDTILIRAPKSARTSLEACQAYESGSVAFEVAVDPTDANRLVLKIKGDDTPAIEGGEAQGSVVVDDEKIVVTPRENVTEITLNHPGSRKVEIPPRVGKICGVTDSTKIVIRGGSHDITAAMKFTPVSNGFAIELNGEAKVKVGNEDIPVTPELARDSGETPFEMKDGEFVFRVKSIPGLTYQVLVSDSLDPTGFASAGEAQEATDTRRELSVTRSGKTKGFFKIQVSR